MIEKMKEQGVLFNSIDEENALKYISERTSFFRIYAYRKNFPKHEKKGYNVEFQAFADLGTCDLILREHLFKMAISTEYMLKTRLLNEIKTTTNEDCHTIVAEFLKADNTTKDAVLKSWKKNPYHTPLLPEESTLPLWSFLEFITFSKLVKFCKFYKTKYPNSQILSDENMLLLNSVANIRNACAHNNLLLVDMYNHPLELNGTAVELCKQYGFKTSEIAFFKPYDFFFLFVFFNKMNTRVVKNFRKQDFENYLKFIRSKEWLSQSESLTNFINFIEKLTTLIDNETHI